MRKLENEMRKKTHHFYGIFHKIPEYSRKNPEFATFIPDSVFLSLHSSFLITPFEFSHHFFKFSHHFFEFFWGKRVHLYSALVIWAKALYSGEILRNIF